MPAKKKLIRHIDSGPKGRYVPGSGVRKQDMYDEYMENYARPAMRDMVKKKKKGTKVAKKRGLKIKKA